MVVYTKEYQEINLILKEWNPIGVPEPSLSEEYTSYIPIIIQKRKDKQILLDYLEELLIEVIGVDYNPSNKEHKEDILSIVDKLCNL